MGNNRSYTQQVHHNSTTINNTNTSSKTFFFFPMLCRLSLNDVVTKPTKLTDLSSSSSSPDPSSPKISCIGQIKRRSTTATTNYHHTSTRITGKSANYTKLRKLFSSKNLISPPIETSTIRNHNPNRNCSRICNGDVTKLIDTKKVKHNVVISIEDLDPPLPVVKIINCTDDKLNVSLGQRRGIELKTLQIQPFQLSTVHS